MEIKIGFIGFGEVASKLATELLKNGLEVFTCIVGRSDLTQKAALEKKIELFSNYKIMAKKSDMIISAVTPDSAVQAAASVGNDFKGIYVDLNSISPLQLIEASNNLKSAKVVDGAIIGSIDQHISEVQIIASGEHASKFARLNDFGLRINIVGTEIGQASAIKMLRSSYTKGLSALLWETFKAAYKLGIEEELFKTISITEGPQFESAAISRIKSTAFHASRRAEEMQNVESFLSEIDNPLMVHCVEKTFKEISQKLGKLKQKPPTPREVFQLWESE